MGGVAAQPPTAPQVVERSTGFASLQQESELGAVDTHQGDDGKKSAVEQMTLTTDSIISDTPKEHPDRIDGESNISEHAEHDPVVESCCSIDGKWMSADSGEWMGTVHGMTLQWAEGPSVQLVQLSHRSFSCEMSAEGVTETFSFEVDVDGRLVWCDGDVWVCTTPSTD